MNFKFKFFHFCRVCLHYIIQQLYEISIMDIFCRNSFIQSDSFSDLWDFGYQSTAPLIQLDLVLDLAQFQQMGGYDRSQVRNLLMKHWRQHFYLIFIVKI